jgi:hypothetical protein
VDNSTAKKTGDASVKQVAEHIRHHPKTIRIMARSGDLPNTYKAWRDRTNSPLRIPGASVDRYRALQLRAAD